MTFLFATNGFLNTCTCMTFSFLFEVATVERNSPLVSLRVFDVIVHVEHGFFFIALKNLVLILFSFEHVFLSFSATIRMYETPESCSRVWVVHVLLTVNTCGGTSKLLSLLLD